MFGQNIGKWRLPRKSRENLLYVSSRPFPFRCQTLQVTQCLEKVSTSNECPTNESQAANFNCLFRRYCHILAYTRQTYRPCSTTWRYYTTRSRNWPCTNAISLQLISIISFMYFDLCAPIFLTRMIDVLLALELLTALMELRSVFAIGNVFPGFELTLASVACLVINKVCKCHQPTLSTERPKDVEAALEPIKQNLWNLWACPSTLAIRL